MKKTYIKPSCVVCDLAAEEVFMEGSYNVDPEQKAEQWSISGDEGYDTWHSSLWDEEE